MDEIIFIPILFLLTFLVFICPMLEAEEEKEKYILEQSEEYVIYENCEQIAGKYYCITEKEDN